MAAPYSSDRDMAPKSLRRLLPKVQVGIGTKEPSEPAKKRKLIPLACARCRSHKTKCNGHRPSCGPCQARNVDCKYDDNPNTTPTANLRRQYHHLDEQYQPLHKLFEMLRSRPEDEALIILQHFRASGDVQSTLRHVEAGYLLAEANDDILFAPCSTRAASRSFSASTTPRPTRSCRPSRKCSPNSAIR
jgi:hypothetical protein